MNKPSSGRGGPFAKGFLNIKRFGPQIQPNLAQILNQTGLFTADMCVSRRSGLEEAEQFEHNHDNDDYSDYVEDVSVHAGDSYQIARAMVNIYPSLSAITAFHCSEDSPNESTQLITGKGPER